MLRAALLATIALLLLPAVAGAYVVQDRGGLLSSTNGLALGPDGNLWVTEYGNGTVVRMTPAGRVLQRFPVGSQPTSVATGPGGRVWVAGTGSTTLYWIDAQAAAPTVHPVPIGGTCGPTAITSGGNGRMYFAAPCTGDPGNSRIGSVRDDGTDLDAQTGRGTAFDLEVSGGKLFVPDFAGDIVRRLRLSDLGIESTVTTGVGNPDGIAVDGSGRIWVTLYTAGTLAHFPATQDGGGVTKLPASGLQQPFGIVLGADGRLYVAAQGSSEIARVDPSTSTVVRYGVQGAEPFQIINGPDGDLYFTDTNASRILYFVNSAPRASTVAARALATTAGSVDAKVDSRGNATQVVFDYGTTTAYGSTTAPQTVAAGIGASDVRADLPALEPGTTYHVRVRATNAEGGATGQDVSFTTPAPDPTPVRAAVSFRWGFTTSYTVLTRVRVRQVTRKDTVKLTCKGRGCAVKKKTVRGKKGVVNFTRYFGTERRLRKGAKVRLRITAPGRIGAVATLKVRRGKDPKVTRRCVLPGTTTLRKRC